MAPDVNWSMIDSLAKGESHTTNEDYMEEMADVLHGVTEAEYEGDPEKMAMLFKSAMKILDYRENAVDDILQEQAETVAQKEIEIDKLKHQLEDEKTFGGGNVTRDAEFFRIENRRLLETVESYREEKNDLKQELDSIMEDRNRVDQELEESKRRFKELKNENEELRYNIREYTDIMENQQQQKLSIQGDANAEAKEKLNEKNKQISDLLTQITQLEEVNRELEETSQKLRSEMESGQEEMEKMADEYEKMRKVIGATDHFADDIHRQNAQLKMQVSDLRDQLHAKAGEEDSIAEAVNEKVAVWSAKLRERDEENTEQRRLIEVLRQKMSAANLDQDRRDVERLTKKLGEREEDLKQLQTALSQAVGDLEEQTAIVEDLRKDKGTNREALAYKSQIKKLQSQIQKQESIARDAGEQRATAEQEAQENDAKLTEALRRISLLESGQYGLTEAVNEIKEHKNLVRLREKDIQQLTQQANQLEEKLNDVLEENEEYRERLGINPRDLEDIAHLRKSRALRQQQYRAENQVLLKEIERLEEERLEFKQQIRRQAQSQTQKVMGEGLHPEDVELLDEFMEELSKNRKQGIGSDRSSVRNALAKPRYGPSKHSWRVNDLSKEAEEAERRLHHAQSENMRLEEESKITLAENQQLRVAMKDILEALKKSQGPSASTESIRIPSLERLLHAIEARHTSGRGDMVHFKAQVDQLTGRNEELRSELRSMREEQYSIGAEKKALEKQITQLKSQLGLLDEEAGDGQMIFTRVKMPLAKNPASDDVINALNEHLIQVMDSEAKKEISVKDLKEKLENARRQLQVLRHQTHLIYKDHETQKEKWNTEKKNREDNITKMQETADKNTIRLEEYERLLVSLQSNPDEVKQRLGETSRKISLLRVNERTLIRRHKALEASEDLLTAENSRLKKEISLIERAVSERIGYLERYKAMSSFKIDSLQKALEGSIPEAELSLVNRRFDELTAKYRDLLQKENQFVARNVKFDTMQAEIKIVHEAAEALRQELAIEKEKRHTIEASLKRYDVSPLKSSNKDWINTEMDSVLKKVTVLEMKELNERQKAEHATRMYNQFRSSLDDMQTRNSELEQKFSELTKLNLVAQKTERDLRDELAEVVPKTVSDADRKKISKLEEELAKTKVKMSKLQDMSDISHHQLHSVQSQQQARDREMKSLRQQLREFEIQTDQNALIGKLHHQILNLQASEIDAQRKLELIKKNVTKLQAHVIKLEKQLDEKDDAIYLTRTETSSRNRQLKKTIQRLRQQFSGALPLIQQEKFSKSLIRLQEDKVLIQGELRKMRVERERLEDKLAEADIQKQGLEELRKAIEDQRGADKLTEWSHRMDKLRLQDMKLQRQVVRQSEQIKYLDSMGGQHEKTISSLEEDVVTILKAQEERQVEWEMREMELERLLDQFQSQQHEVKKKARRLEDITQTLPDPSLPIDIQLTKALETIKEQIDTIKNMQGQNKALEFENDRLKDIRHTLEGDITTRDKIITELRLHVPDSSVGPYIPTKDTDSKQQLKVALETIDTLKKRLSGKEESLNRLKQLLEEARKEQEALASNHERELLKMQQKIHGKSDDVINKFKLAASPGASRSNAPTMQQLRHLNELEGMVKEQDAAMAALMDRVRAANADVIKQKRTIAENRKEFDDEKKKQTDEHETKMKTIQIKLAKKCRRVDDLEKELLALQNELEQQKNANTRTPSSAMKNLVARLKLQLEEKEKQQQKLNNALSELRADLVHQAEENVRAHSAGLDNASNVKVLVEKRTTHCKAHVEELKDKVAELQRAMKLAQRTEDTLRAELKKILEEAETKQQTIGRLKKELKVKDSDNTQLRDKIKRIVNSKGLDSGLKFTEERPVKLGTDSSENSDDQKKKKKGGAVEETVVPVVVATEKTSRPSSARSKVPIPRGRSSVVDMERFNKLKSELNLIKEENDNLKQKLKLKTEEPNKNAIEVAKWDVKKQWQGKVDDLKDKLEKKDKQIQAVEKQSNSLRDTIARLEREKLRRAAAPIGPPIHAQATLGESVPPSDLAARKHLHQIEDLSHRLHRLGEENSQLRKEKVLPREKLAAEMEAKNKNLTDKLEALQKEIVTAGVRQQRDETLATQFQERENDMQGRILKLSSDVTQLKFELEQIKRDVPRLQERVEFQQNYINLLQSEKKEALARLERAKGQQNRKQPSQGTSGKSVVELEKTVVLMKKVVERVERENEQMKRAPGVVSNRMLDELKAENQLLKNRINEMTQQIGGQLSMRYESKTQSVDRLVKENERMRKDMEKNAMSRDKINRTKAALQVDKDKLVKELEEMKKRLEIAEKKAPKLAGAGSRGYNSAVTSKMLESRLKKSEEELQRKTSELQAVTSLVQEKTTSEEMLLEDNDRLREQIEILERFPPGAGGSDPNTVRELQIQRLTVARLESEKSELKHEADRLRKRLGGEKEDAVSVETDLGNEVAVRAENLRLETELRVMRQERENLNSEVQKMKVELSHFDGEFFDEIEDLKYNYAESVKKNLLYEEQLRSLSQQFGVSVDIPFSDD